MDVENSGVNLAGNTVRVQRYIGLPGAGQEGTVTRTYNAGGELMAVVEFADGTTEHYDMSQIRRV